MLNHKNQPGFWQRMARRDKVSLLSVSLMFVAAGGIFLSFSHAASVPTISQRLASTVAAQITRLDTTVPKPAGANATNWPDPTCPRCNAGIGEAAAAAAFVTKDPAMLARSKTVFDDLIAHEPQAGLTASNNIADSSGPGLGSMFNITQLEPSLIMLRPQLDTAHIKSWTRSVTYSADWLIADGDLTYYSNGNINIGMAGVMASAYHETGNPSYQAQYKVALDFLEKPTLPRWAGYGFIVTKAATKADGSDGAGYFTEQGAGGNGLDMDYTQFQEDQLARIYLINHDPKILYYMNMLMNTLLTKVDRTKMTLDTGNGTRHTQPSPRLITFNSGALSVLAKNGRADLAPIVARQQDEIITFMNIPYSTAGYLYDLGMVPGLVIMSDNNVFEPAHAPAVSTDVTAPGQIGNFKAAASGPTTVAMSWTPPINDPSVVKYYIRRQGPIGNWPIATVLGGTTSSFTDTTAVPATQYTYSVQAVDLAGNLSIKSAPVVVTTAATSTTTVVGDVNGDKRVNALDLSLLLTHDGQKYDPADFNKDGTVGAADLAIMLSHWTW